MLIELGCISTSKEFTVPFKYTSSVYKLIYYLHHSRLVQSRYIALNIAQ